MAGRKRVAELDMAVLREQFKQVGGDAELARTILDLALASAYGFNKAFDEIVEKHRLAKQQELDVPEAERVLRRDYWEDVQGVAKDLKSQIDDGEITDAEGLDTRLHETVDGTQRVIYTHQAQLGLVFSENDDAYWEEGLGGQRDEPNWSVLMYAAMRGDVIDELERMGVDVNDPAPEEDEDDDEEMPYMGGGPDKDD